MSDHFTMKVINYWQGWWTEFVQISLSWDLGLPAIDRALRGHHYSAVDVATGTDSLSAIEAAITNASIARSKLDGPVLQARSLNHPAKRS